MLKQLSVINGHKSSQVAGWKPSATETLPWKRLRHSQWRVVDVGSRGPCHLTWVQMTIALVLLHLNPLEDPFFNPGASKFSNSNHFSLLFIPC
ncbi:hypothetical protein TNIN_116261 [Trichonephila inaurata madagascariensis]|uniref:Uncharacterized protein n=1 Tax=Trichonephila inaurata madagascariensis TaxID=2747483 RepID=A0A8X7BRL1_9ARAC|nr:hypothetical protein TNIN_116261 [Trichonephila inaurata madagascariensis]